jgi:putative FmdB family regulatory protein
MPIYEYKCKLCDGRFEIEQRISDDALTSLPGCAESDDGDHWLRKVFSAVGISFKGDGFYRNDSRASSQKSNGGQSPRSDSDGKEPSRSDSGGKESSPASTDSSSGSAGPSSGSKAATGSGSSSSSD